MGNMIKYLGMIVTVVLIFHLSGVLVESGTPNSMLLNLALHPETLTAGQNTFYTLFAVSLVALIGGGAVIGFITKQEWAIWAIMFVPFMLLAMDLVKIYSFLATSSIIFATIFIAPILVMYILATVEWIRGFD